MSYVKNYLFDVAEAIHRKKTKAGDEVEVEFETASGKQKKTIRISPEDMQAYREIYGLPDHPSKEQERKEYEGKGF